MAELNHRLLWLFACLINRYGPQYWWPGESQFEIMVGAILTQNATWSNVERAIARLSAAEALSPEQILSLPTSELAELIQPAGYFNIKAKRLRSLCNFLQDTGGLDHLKQWDTERLRAAFLTVHGIGPETADDILLYAFERRVFVVDSYTRRIGERLGLFPSNVKYEVIRAMFEAIDCWDYKQFNELHALLVQHAKQVCRKHPKCEHCCLTYGTYGCQMYIAQLK